MSRMCTIKGRGSHAFISAPIAVIGGVALTASLALAQVTPSPADIVFVSTRDGNANIYSVRADGTNLTRLTSNPAHDYAPAWSPDGKRIAFASERDGSPEIYVMNADGTNVVRRTFSASYSGDPCWSPDGKRIVYSTLSNGSLNVWTLSPDSGAPALLLERPGYDAHPALSPDGGLLAVTSDWYAYDFVFDVFIANGDGTGWTGLTGNIFDHVDYVRPSWSPNGAKLAVTIMETTGIDQYVTRLGVMNANGSGLTPLIGAAAWTKSSWSPDGTRIAFTSVSLSGGLNISWVSATDGSKSGTIVTNGYNPDWRRDVIVQPPSQPPTVTITAPAAGATYTAPATITVTAAASDSDGTIAKVDFYSGSTRVGTDSTGPYSASLSAVTAGSYALTAVATDNAGLQATSAVVTITVATAPPPTSTPYGGTPASVPGTIQAEKFDKGGQGLAYYDTSPGNTGGQYRTTDVDIQATTDAGGGYNIGWIKAGEWLKYTVSVASAGNYTLAARVACYGPGGTFHVEVDGKDATGPLRIPNTGGWQLWSDVVKSVTLPAGTHVLRVAFDTAGSSGAVGNLNSLRLTK